MTTRKILLFAALAAALLVGAAAATSTLLGSQADDPPPALPEGALAEPVTLVSATPFTLDESMLHAWSAEPRSYDAGLVLVLQVADRELLHPRQLAEPVLFAGALPVERVNVGHVSGYVVAVLPSERDSSGRPAVAGTALPLFLGDPALPEQVDAATGQRMVAQALAAGVPLTTLAAAPGEPLAFPDHGELRAWIAATLLAAHAPDEQDLITGLMVPRLSR